MASGPGRCVGRTDTDDTLFSSHNSTLSLVFETSTGLDVVEVIVDVDLQQDSRMVRRAASFCWNHSSETQLAAVKLVNEHIDHSQRICIRHVIIRLSGSSVLWPRCSP